MVLLKLHRIFLKTLSGSGDKPSGCSRARRDRAAVFRPRPRRHRVRLP